MNSNTTTDENNTENSEIPTTRKGIEEIVRNLTVSVLMLDDVEPEDLDSDVEDFLVELGCNSIDALELIVTCESAFCIEFDDTELNADLVKTLSHFINSICGKLGIFVEQPPQSDVVIGPDGD